jgi:hypothetical protein
MEKKHIGSCNRVTGIKFWKKIYLHETVVGQIEVIAYNVLVINVLQGRVKKSSQYKQGFLKCSLQVFVL